MYEDESLCYAFYTWCLAHPIALFSFALVNILWRGMNNCYMSQELDYTLFPSALPPLHTGLIDHRACVPALAGGFIDAVSILEQVYVRHGCS
ncbi:uncharacterized protein BT62DRAFT_1080289 [Guyanagaster necrorhizus]|uniref:Uncharacterized protein n=1 Tax=Guyanagaster necrorhizus TaxID=856835 RepID=A0A9P8AMB5_9AGAR|nr:uncharacterized protein BT62DRAFT_1080289 [Guyanagaster necrorhizus MCA 3950]KAG7441093.1 hypothetical protein BT62DRAFT_1080289 [Guyanagaster necrorhizus MCA 3950]